MSANDKSLKALRYMVIAMGVTLIGGVILLFTLIIKKEKSPNYDVAPYALSSLSSSKPSYDSSDCTGGELNIEENGVIENVMLDNQRLIMLISGIKDDDSQKIVIVDRCQNKIINRIVLKRKPEKADDQASIN